jgi:hypothetical protein
MVERFCLRKKVLKIGLWHKLRPMCVLFLVLVWGKSIGEPKSQNDNYYSCYILDLDGYLLEAVYRNKD